jgi:iron complex transport system ATP-binding protein
MAVDSILDIVNLEIGFDLKTKSMPFYPLVNVSSTKGDFIALLGRNGIGKSTFLRSIARIQPFIAGDVRIKGTSINRIERIEFSKKLSFIPAEPIHAANMTVLEFVTLARYPYNGWFGAISNSDREMIHSALEHVSMQNFSNRELDTLSDGERQKAMIAFAFAQDSEIILMDEPTAFIDLPAKYEVVRLLKDLTLRGKTVIFSTHDLHTAIREVDTIWLMLKDGLKVGSPEDLALDSTLNRLFDGTDIYLDSITGGFFSKRVSSKRISLSADNEIYFIWTKRALERIGFTVVAEVDDLNPTINCSYIENKWKWNVNYNSSNFNFENISKLCNYLKTII